eukprot:scaffold625_cov169-Skeletonema_dohrnii-CCMP3373.AAC.15
MWRGRIKGCRGGRLCSADGCSNHVVVKGGVRVKHGAKPNSKDQTIQREGCTNQAENEESALGMAQRSNHATGKDAQTEKKAWGKSNTTRRTRGMEHIAILT